jgi:Zn-dependent M28 family amino/carboxypeptidase
VPTRRLLLLPILALASCGDDVDSDVDAGVRDAAPDTGTDLGQDAGPLPECGTDSPLALSQCVDRARYDTDLQFVAMERVPESTYWMAVQDRCADTLEDLGFAVERHDYGTGVNVLGVLEGTSEPGRRVLVGAHYDHIAGCQGADDNASGVAATLEVARVLAQRDYPRTLTVACWDEEERGLVGSQAYVEREVGAGRTFDVYFNFEMIGYYADEPETQNLPVGFDLIFREPVMELEANDNRGDFIALIGDELASEWLGALDGYGERVGMPAIPIEVATEFKDDPAFGDLRRSDHAPFWLADIPAIMITDTSEFRYDAYHCRDGDDVIENLDTERASLVTSLTVAAAAEALGL